MKREQMKKNYKTMRQINKNTSDLKCVVCGRISYPMLDDGTYPKGAFKCCNMCYTKPVQNGARITPIKARMVRGENVPM